MNLKALTERREEMQNSMATLLSACENRAMTEEERAQFDQLEADIKSIDETIAREERARDLMDKKPTEQSNDKADEEVRAFEHYIRTGEVRAANIDMGGNGAIIPVTIAEQIIKKVVDICPILAGATRYSVPGTLKVPVWGATDSGDNITVGYQTEFNDITANAGHFSSVDLGGYLAGALALIGRSVINNAAVPVVEFVVDQMAEEIAVWLEGQLLNGTGVNAAGGALLTTNSVTSKATSIGADDLIALQAQVKQAYQADACWTMSSDTFVEIKKLKDSNGRFLLQDDISGDFPYRLLGKPVYLSDNMPAATAGNAAILYGDYSGLSVNFRENIQIEIQRELYSAKHAIGITGWFEFDSKVTNEQKLAKLVIKA